MPTFREDLHLGHDVTLVDTDDINDKAITEDKLADGSVSKRALQDGCVTEPKLADDAVSTRTIQDGAVTTPKIEDKAVTPEKLSDRVVPEVIEPLLKPLRDKDADLQNQIDSLEIAGVAVSNEFGTDPHISISQKTMTDAINKLWQKLEDMTGEVLQGISMSVTPDYFISEDGCSVHISANTVETNGIFEHIAFYGNGSLIAEADNVDFFEYDTEITETTIIKCVAKIMGIEYTRQQIVTHYNSFWLGAGSTYSDIMDSQHARQLNGRMRHDYDVTFTEGQKLIIVMGASLRDWFIRADLNGAEIELTEQSVTIDGKQYVAFLSEPWSAGDYNIDING